MIRVGQGSRPRVCRRPGVTQHADVLATIGRFRVESLLGVGGMGEVYKAVDPTLQRTVAIKTVPPGHRSTRITSSGSYREAQACARLAHPNIVTVYEAGEFEGVGSTSRWSTSRARDLADRAAAAASSPLRSQDSLSCLQVLDALHHAHNEDVVHRDIKPSNVYRQLDGIDQARRLRARAHDAAPRR